MEYHQRLPSFAFVARSAQGESEVENEQDYSAEESLDDRPRKRQRRPVNVS